MLRKGGGEIGEIYREFLGKMTHLAPLVVIIYL